LGGGGRESPMKHGARGASRGGHGRGRTGRGRAGGEAGEGRGKGGPASNQTKIQLFSL